VKYESCLTESLNTTKVGRRLRAFALEGGRSHGDNEGGTDKETAEVFPLALMS